MERIERIDMAKNATLDEATIERIERLLSVERDAKRGERARRRRRTKLPKLTRDRGGVVVSVRGEDTGTPERAQHDVLVDEGSGQRHKRVVTQTPLDRYFRRGELHADAAHNERLWKAGERLRSVFYRTGFLPRLVVDLTGVGGQGKGDYGDTQVAAVENCRRALRRVGVELAPVLVHVCCLDMGAADWAHMRGHRGRRAQIVGMTTLQLALDALAKHYCIDVERRATRSVATESRARTVRPRP